MAKKKKKKNHPTNLEINKIRNENTNQIPENQNTMYTEKWPRGWKAPIIHLGFYQCVWIMPPMHSLFQLHTVQKEKK